MGCSDITGTGKLGNTVGDSSGMLFIQSLIEILQLIENLFHGTDISAQGLEMLQPYLF
jgi:hypothetical protein